MPNTETTSTPLTFDKQIAFYILLATRSWYRKMLENSPPPPPLPVDNPGAMGPQESGDLEKMIANAPPPGFSPSDVQALTNPQTQFGMLFVDHTKSNAPQIANISTDPVIITMAVHPNYDDGSSVGCPDTTAWDAIANCIIGNPVLVAQQPTEPMHKHNAKKG
jgi:hypothetical protein